MDEILINKTTTGDQQQPGIAGFTGLQFAVAWADRDTGNIKGRLFGVNGVPSGDEFTVNFPGTPGTKRHLPTIIETRRGLAAAWIEQLPGAPPQLKLRTFDQDTLSGPESQVSTAEVEPLIRPALAQLPDGGFVVVWADKRQDERIRAQRYDIDGMKSGPEFRANTAPGLHRVPMVACLANGNIVIAWRARLPGPLLVHFQIFDANGPVGTEQTTALDVTEIAMTALDSGRFVIAHVRSALDGEAGFDTTVAQVERVRGERHFRQYPLCSHQCRPDPILLADAGAVTRRALSAGMDTGERRQPGRRHQRRGKNFLRPGADRSSRSRSTP